jgi:hypothetical protein
MAAERLRDERGSALIAVILISMIIGALTSLALATGRQAEWSSASDRNRDQTLGVGEAGLNQVIGRVTAQAVTPPSSGPNFWAMTPGSALPTSCGPSSGAAAPSCTAAQTDANYSGTTPQGTYWFWVTRCAPGLSPAVPCPGASSTSGFVVDIESTTGGPTLGRKRHIEAVLSPPATFGNNANYALFSYTSIVLQSNDQVLKGDIFANTNISIQNSNAAPAVQGNITSATGYVALSNNVQAIGNVWSGGYYSGSGGPYSVSVAPGAVVNGTVMASATNSGDCASLPNHNYDVSSTGSITGTITTLGSLSGTNSANPAPSVVSGTCTAAAPAQPMPTFTFNPLNYDQSTYHYFPASPPCGNGTGVSGFQNWLAANGNQLQGTFKIDSCSPSQTNRIDLSSATLAGSTTIVTNAPIYTDALNDAQLTNGAVLVLVSHYQPPANTSCSTTSNTSECAIHITNGFSLNSDGTCKTATLVYADLGPVAIKNGSNGQNSTGNLCGSVISNGILVKNQETVTYDGRVHNVVGFGPTTYGITRWQELPAR